MGNFIYLDIYDGNYDIVTRAFQDSVGMVALNSGKPKLSLKNADFKQISFCEIDYQFPISEEEMAVDWNKITYTAQVMI